MTTAFAPDAFQNNAFQIDPARSLGGGGAHYGKAKKRLQPYYKLHPWEAPKVWKKIRLVEKKKADTEAEIRAIQAELRNTQDRLALAKLKATAERLSIQIVELQEELEQLNRIRQELEDDEAQLMLIISRLHI